MPARWLALTVLGLSIAVIAGALSFQYIGGLIPCELCFKERWAWYASIPLSAALAIWYPRAAPPLFALIFLASAALGLYHVGVEQGIFPAPDECRGPKLKAGSVEELTQQILSTPAVLCSEVSTRILWISLAGWNAISSLGLVVLALWSAAGLRRRASA